MSIHPRTRRTHPDGSAPARRRLRRRRSDERGATMFIILMVIAVLSAIGTWALGNSRYEVRTAGYLRQRNVSEVVSGYGARAVTSEIGTAPKAYLGLLNKKGDLCEANGGLGATGPTTAMPPCYHLRDPDIQNRAGMVLFQGPVLSGPGIPGIPGSLGMTTMAGGFNVEFTDPMLVGRVKPGESVDDHAPQFLDVTMSVSGVIYQDEPGGVMGVIDASERPSATFTGARGHLFVGPIY